jgi:hypothetical protein
MATQTSKPAQPEDQVTATRTVLRVMNAAAGHGGPNATAAIEAADKIIDATAGKPK